MRRVQLLAMMAGLTLACVGAYSERPDTAGRAASGVEEAAPDTAALETAEAAAGAGGALVGHVTPDGRFHADTGAGAAEPLRVERETVVTGTVRAAGATEGRPAGAPEEDPAPPGTPEAPAGEAAGYRVQVFAAEDPATAAEVARRLEARLEGTPVSVEREGHWHKVRVGDFATRGEAEPLRARLAGMGYSGVWIVPTTVRAPR